MDNNALFFYQNFILIFIAGGAVSLLYALLHHKKRRWIAGGLTLICAFTIIWYFLPFQIYLDPNLPVEVTLVCGDTRIAVSEEEAQQLTSVCNTLIYTRRVGQRRIQRSTQDYIYLRIVNAEKEINLELAVDENGFPLYPGLYGITYGMDYIKNPKALITYVKSLRA